MLVYKKKKKKSKRVTVRGSSVSRSDNLSQLIRHDNLLIQLERTSSGCRYREIIRFTIWPVYREIFTDLEAKSALYNNIVGKC